MTEVGNWELPESLGRRLFAYTDEFGDTLHVDLLATGELGLRTVSDLGGGSWAATSVLLPAETARKVRAALDALPPDPEEAAARKAAAARRAEDEAYLERGGDNEAIARRRFVPLRPRGWDPGPQPPRYGDERTAP